nr:hypothetical protein [Tanacetum cinerariifolium]
MTGVIKQEPANYALMTFSSSSSSSDNERFQEEKEPTNYALMSFTSSSSSNSDNESDESLPPSPRYDSVNKTTHTAFNVDHRPTKPDKDLFHTHRPSAPIIKVWVSNLEDDSEAEIPQNAPSFVQPIEQVKTPRPSVKTIETSIPTATHKTAIPKPKNNGNHKNIKACFVCKSLDHLIKDCDFYEKKMAQTHTSYWYYPKTVVTKSYSPPRRHINHSQSPKASTFPLKVTAAEAPMVNAVKGNWGNLQHALKDKGVIDSG